MARPPKQDRESIRSKRASLVLKPATYDRLIAFARQKGFSRSGFFAKLLDKIALQDDLFIEEFTADFKPVWKKKPAQPST